MPSSGTLMFSGLVLLALAGAEYFGLLAKYDAPVRDGAGPLFPIILLMIALIGFACLAGSFFNRN